MYRRIAIFMNCFQLEDARLELEFFDNPDYNYDDNEDDIIDLSVELYDNDEGEQLWDTFMEEYEDDFVQSFGENSVIEFADNESLCKEILKHADKFAKILLNDNDYLPAYNVMVSINVWGTGEQYAIDQPIDVIE